MYYFKFYLNTDEIVLDIFLLQNIFIVFKINCQRLKIILILDEFLFIKFSQFISKNLSILIGYCTMLYIHFLFLNRSAALFMLLVCFNLFKSSYLVIFCIFSLFIISSFMVTKWNVNLQILICLIYREKKNHKKMGVDEIFKISNTLFCLKNDNFYQN